LRNHVLGNRVSGAAAKTWYLDSLYSPLGTHLLLSVTLRKLACFGRLEEKFALFDSESKLLLLVSAEACLDCDFP
jgi:hypothetical protein